MKTLQNYYGKKLAYVITKLKNGKIETRQEIKTVYDPHDFSRRVAPAAGCDLVIGDNSANSKDIFDIGGIGGTTAGFSFGRFDSIILFNYCELEQVEQVTAEHINLIKNTLIEFISKQQERIDNVNEILKTL